MFFGLEVTFLEEVEKDDYIASFDTKAEVCAHIRTLKQAEVCDVIVYAYTDEGECLGEYPHYLAGAKQ